MTPNQASKSAIDRRLLRMPPCGYRPLAVDSIKMFLEDNLKYFIELYSGRGISIEQALAIESGEIALLRQGVRGGVWSAKAVELNKLFYDRLALRSAKTWDQVEVEGKKLICEAVEDLNSLTAPSI